MKINPTYSRSDNIKIHIEYAIKRLRYIVVFFTLRRGFLGSQTIILSKSFIRKCKNINIGRKVFVDCRFCSFVSIGENCSLRDEVYISTLGSVFDNKSSSLFIGNNVGISERCYFQVRGDLTIGDNTIIGPNSTIITENHNYESSDQLIRLQGTNRSGVKISNDCWIGANVTILDGVTLGSRTVVAAGAVVTKSFSGNCIIAGVPAKIVKNLIEMEKL